MTLLLLLFGILFHVEEETKVKKNSNDKKITTEFLPVN